MARWVEINTRMKKKKKLYFSVFNQNKVNLSVKLEVPLYLVKRKTFKIYRIICASNHPHTAPLQWNVTQLYWNPEEEMCFGNIKIWYIYTMEYYSAIKMDEIMHLQQHGLIYILSCEVRRRKTNTLWYHLHVKSGKKKWYKWTYL